MSTGARNVLPNYIIDSLHHHLHLGNSYVNHFYSVLTDGDSIRVVMITGASSCHYNFVVNTNGPVLLSFYEDPVVSATAGLVTKVNSNRQSSNTALSSTYTGCTVSTNNGTLLFEQRIVGTTGGTKEIVASQGGQGEIKNEFILKTNSYYQLVIKNTAAATIVIDYDAQCYEEI